MKKFSGRWKRVHDVGYAQGNAVVVDDIKFFTGAAVTLLAPTLLCCLVLGQLWPLYLMTCSEALGTTLGIIKYRKPTAGFLSCMPATGGAEATVSARSPITQGGSLITAS